MESFVEKIKNTKDEELSFLSKGQNSIQFKNFLNTLWNQYSNYAVEKSFINDCNSAGLHPRFWEMYLGCALLDVGFELIVQKEEGPDFCIKNPKIWIEAVASTDGLLDKSEDSNLPMKKVAKFSPSTPGHFGVDEDKQVIRYAYSIKEKIKKHKNYIEGGVVNLEEPYVIALNGYKTKYSIFNYENIDGMLPTFFKSVFPIGVNYEYRPTIEQPNVSLISTDIFINEKYSNISGLLYSNVGLQWVYSWLPEKLASNFTFIHNPLAVTKLPIGWLKAGVEYYFDDNDCLVRRDYEKDTIEKRFQIFRANEEWKLIDIKI